VHALPDAEGLRIGPEPADIVVPEMPVHLLLGRSGFVWTVQLAGTVSQAAVTFGGIPLTAVPMPWRSGQVLSAGGAALTLENAAPAKACFADQATETSIALARTGAAYADAYGLALGVAGSSYARLLAVAAVTAFDPRLLDPARGAALGALNVTLAVREARRGSSGAAEDEASLRIAVLGADAKGELRAAANFDVSVLAITEGGVIQLSGPVAQTRPGVIPLGIRPAQDLGEQPIVLLAGGVSTADVRQCLTGATALNASPHEVTRAVTALPETAAVAAAAVLVRPLRAGSGSRWQP
jgi:hypothetical protein